MKKFGLVIVIFLMISTFSFSQIFVQDFNSSTLLADYFNVNPGIDQFRSIGVSDIGSTVNIVANSLVMTRNTGNSAYAERNYDFSTLPSGLYFQFTFSVSGTYLPSNNAFYVYIGSDVGNTGSYASPLSTYARFSINTTSNTGEFQIRDVTNNVNGVSYFSGVQTITWVLNNTGSTKNYLGPNNVVQNLDNDRSDIWVGNILEFENIAVQTSTETLRRFKFLARDWENGTTFTLDNIYIDNEDALPVELTSFSATTIGKDVKLSWNTATEINNYGFEVERSVVKGNWEKIGFINGNGNSNSPKNYSFVDNKVSAGKYSYRLKQIDNDGQFEYSKTIEVDMNGVKKYELSQNYPNPFNPTTTISYILPQSGMVRLTLYNILGQEIRTLVNEVKEAGTHTFNFDASDLNSGVYVYKIESGSFTQTKKMTLVK